MGCLALTGAGHALCGGRSWCRFDVQRPGLECR